MVKVNIPHLIERWSTEAFFVGGFGFFLAFVLLGLQLVTRVTIPELLLSLLVIPSFLAVFFVGLPGFYPYVSDGAPRLALGGLVTAAIGGMCIGVVVVGKIALDLLGVVAFTEEGPLVVLLFVILLGYFLSFLFYGLASLLTGSPSTLVGLLLLVIIVEPLSGILVDLLGFELGDVGGVLTLGIASVAILGIGYGLRANSRQSPQMTT